MYAQNGLTYTKMSVGMDVSIISIKSFSVSFDSSILVLIDQLYDLYFLKYDNSAQKYQNKVQFGKVTASDLIIISKDNSTVVTYG
jgi:hypothetical protein